MWESRYVFRPTQFAMSVPQLQKDYDAVWDGFKSSINEARRDARPGAQELGRVGERPGLRLPIQNLPFGIFRRKARKEPRVRRRHRRPDPRSCGARGAHRATLNGLAASGRPALRALRRQLSRALRERSTQRNRLAAISCRCGKPNSCCRLRSATTAILHGIHHATNIGRILRPDNPLLPNYKWLPIGYHGRASSSWSPARRSGDLGARSSRRGAGAGLCTQQATRL